MYASQTKRLCVRGARQSDETSRVQHHSTSSSEDATGSISIQSHLNQTSSTNLPSTFNIVGSTMTASASGSSGRNDESSQPTFNTTQPFSPFPNQTNSINSDAGDSSKLPQDGTRRVEHELINKLANETLEETRTELLISIRNLITACNKKKDAVVSNPNFIRIIKLIDDDTSSRTKTQIALLLCSIAKSGEHIIKVFNEMMVDDKIFKLLLNAHDEELIEASLRCMRSIMSWPKISRTSLLYDHQQQLNPMNSTKDADLASQTKNNLEKLIKYARDSNSITVQECVADLFAATCIKNREQTMLHKASSLPCAIQLLESSSIRVTIAALNWLTQMSSRNHVISLELTQANCPSNTPVLDRLTILMSKVNCYELQFLSAKCFGQIYRALTTDNLKDDPRIVSHVLPTLIRMVQKDKPPHFRIKSAECIAYLTERETRLQNIASICDRLIESLADMLEYEHSSTRLGTETSSDILKCARPQSRRITYREIINDLNQLDQSNPPPPPPPTLDLNISQTDAFSSETNSGHDTNIELNEDMKRAAFLALASLASNLEPIRKKIFNTCSVMQHLVKGLTDNDVKTLKSVLICLLSLSRSVQQLRTSFAENSVYTALKNLLSTTSDDVLLLVLAILCNISLDFSPGKTHFLDNKTIEVLCNLTRRSESILKLHGMWVLMNMVYQLKDQNLKFQILRSLGINHILSLLDTEDDEEIVLKTLGFIRNLLSHGHTDAIMLGHGEQIVLSLTKILEKPCSNRIKEQTLCVLTNIADGNESKSFIMNNRTVLAYLSKIICDEQAGDLRLAAICCITNLAQKECDRSNERRDEMKKFGIDEKLKSMLNTNDSVLSNRVKTAYDQFLIGVEEKYVN